MFPIILKKSLDSRYLEKWNLQFVAPKRTHSEGIWRRTQEEQTKLKSNWKGAGDARRRMIHFFDEYDVVKSPNGKVDFVLQGAYLWLLATLPREELADYHSRVITSLAASSWEKEGNNSYKKNDLYLTFQHHHVHPEDIKANRNLPPNYESMEYKLASANMDITERLIDSPWRILSTGIRKTGTRTKEPNIVKDLNELLDYLPMQAEIGGGASIELGIPPLNHLHTIYNVTRKSDGTFVFEDDDFLPNLIEDPERFYKNAAGAYVSCLLAEPNSFYKLLKEMDERGLLVGDVITNNFDGLSSLVGLKEKYVRRFDEPKQFPSIEFDPRAKSLLVVGNHADRRTVESQAREKGLKVIFVDPEVYEDYFGNEIVYPLENVEETDLLVHMEAAQFANEFRTVLRNTQG